MVDIGFNQTQTINMNMTSASFMATTNNSGMAGPTGLGFDDVIDPFIDNDWLQEHNLDILFDLFEQEMESKNSYDVGANNSSNLFGSSPVTSYLYGTSPTLASVLDLNDWLYYDTPIADIIPQATVAAPITTTYNCQLQQQPNQQTQQYGYVPIVDNNNLIASNSQSVSGSKSSGKSSNSFDNNNKTTVNGLNNNNNACGNGSSGRSSSSKKSNHVTSSKKLASINNKLTSNISKLNLNNSNLNNFTNNSALGLDKSVINFVNGDNNHHHHHHHNNNNYATSDTNSLTSRMRIKRRSKKGQSEGISLLAKPPLSTSNANNSNISSKNHSSTTKANKSSSVASGSAGGPNNATGSNNVIKNVSRNFELSPNVAIAHQRQMNNKQNSIGGKISRMIHSKKQTTIFKVTTSEAICIDRSKQAQNKNRMSFNNTNLLIPIHHQQVEKTPQDYARSCAIAIEHAYAFRYVN